MNFENCCKCGEALKKIKTPRQRFIKCADCRGGSVQAKFRKIQDDCKATSLIVSSEQIFEDNPRANKDDNVHFRYGISNDSNIRSSLSEISS